MDFQLLDENVYPDEKAFADAFSRAKISHEGCTDVQIQVGKRDFYLTVRLAYEDAQGGRREFFWPIGRFPVFEGGKQVGVHWYKSDANSPVLKVTKSTIRSMGMLVLEMEYDMQAILRWA